MIGDSIIFHDNVNDLIYGKGDNSADPHKEIIKIPLLSYNSQNDTFNKNNLTVELGKQLTGFTILNNVNNPDDYTSDFNNVIIYNNFINKLEITNPGSKYYLDKEGSIFPATLGENIIVTPEIDNNATVGKLELSINDDGYLTNVTIVNSGKNYTKNPIIYLVDHLDNHKVYEFVVFAYIDNLGSISKVEFKR